MNNDDRIVELLTDMLFEMREMKQEQRTTNMRLDKLEEHQAKTNVALGELRLAVTQLADHLDRVADIDRRLTRVEGVVFK